MVNEIETGRKTINLLLANILYFMRYFASFWLIVVLIIFASCNNNSSTDKKIISSEPSVISAGKSIFENSCSNCHNFRQDGIGPNLGGITTKVSVEWLYKFIKDPAGMISAKDEKAVELHNKFKTIMPSFSTLKDDELEAVIAFLQTNKLSNTILPEEDKGRVLNPVPEKIKLSDLIVNLDPVVKFPVSSYNGALPLTRITKLDFEPRTGKLFVNDLRGKLFTLENNTPQIYLDLKKMFPKFIDVPGLATGFGSFAFHPRFAKNGIFYTTHTESPGSGKADFSYADSIKVVVQWVLTEWKATSPEADKFSGTSRELLRINMITGAHGVQEIAFNPLAKPGNKDYGLLYVGVGDGGSVQEGYSFLPHSKERPWGTILRINPFGRNSANGKYGIPSDNPFVHDNNPKTAKEIYAYGFRNPHRITWTRSGKMLVSNIGQANIEAIDLVEPGHDYGWPIREGQFAFNPKGDLNNVYTLPVDDSVYNITYPIAIFDHDEGNAITGGYEYWGEQVPSLKNKFIFGDIPSGRLFYINTADIRQGTQATVHEWRIAVNNIPKSLKQVCGCDRVDLRFGRDAGGELYILTKVNGMLYKMTNVTEKQH
jgi:glucose/arabinose dehydrogenase/cytochrome c2